MIQIQNGDLRFKIFQISFICIFLCMYFCSAKITAENINKNKPKTKLGTLFSSSSPLLKQILASQTPKPKVIRPKKPSKITGSFYTEFEHVDIDNYLNNTTYDRGPTYRIGFVGLGNINHTRFSGLMVTSYNHKKEQKNVELESLRFEFSQDEKLIVLIGQDYPQYTESTMSNEKIEGIKITMNEKTNSLELSHDFFAGISNQYEKVTSINPTPEYQQYLYGSRLNYVYKKNNQFTGIILKAKDDENSVSADTTIIGPLNNEVYGLEYQRILPKGKGEMAFEYTKSRVDKGERIFKMLSDEAYKYRLRYKLKDNLITKLLYRNYGKRFYTAGNTSFNSSEVGYDGALLEYECGLTDVVLDGYLEKYSEESFDTSDIQTDYFIFSNNVKYQFEENQNVTFRTLIRSLKNDDDSIEKFKAGIKLGYSIKVKKRRASIKLDYSKNDDKTPTNSDVTTKGFSASLSDKYLKNRLSLSTYLMGNKTKSSSGITKFSMFNANANAKLIPRKLILLATSIFKYNHSPNEEATRTYTNKFEFKYYLSLKNSLKLMLKNERQMGGESEYNVNDFLLNCTFVF